jgi:hypothetical protein
MNKNLRFNLMVGLGLVVLLLVVILMIGTPEKYEGEGKVSDDEADEYVEKVRGGKTVGEAVIVKPPPPVKSSGSKDSDPDTVAEISGVSTGSIAKSQDFNDLFKSIEEMIDDIDLNKLVESQ